MPRKKSSPRTNPAATTPAANTKPRSDKKIFRPLLVLVSAVVLILLFVPTYFNGTASFDFDLRGQDYGAMFAHLFIVAVIVERFIEVYNATWRRPGRIALENAFRAAKADKDKLEAQAALENYRADTGELAMYSGFVLGLIVALAGVNTLGVLFDVSELPPFQAKIFKAVDILITSGLIAGGSKGINAMTSLIEQGLISTKERIRKNELTAPTS